MVYIPPFRATTPEEYSNAVTGILDLHKEVAANWIRAHKFEYALRALIERADNGTLGSSKVQDMKRIATDALGN